MRYAIFSDIHANLEALEAVLAKIDELAQEKPIEQIWFLGDLVGYGPNPNECILKLRERTNVIIAGNHDWAAVGKIDLEDFSSAARISAEWTAEQLTEEHRTFLTNLPERVEIEDCTLVHGSPYGPLWEYLTSEVLAERSFQYFNSRYCLVGHTHVPVIFQQPDTFSNVPTLPLHSDEQVSALPKSNGIEHHLHGDDDETSEMVAVQSPIQRSTLSIKGTDSVDSAFKETESSQAVIEDEAGSKSEKKLIHTSEEKYVEIEDAKGIAGESEVTTVDFTSPVDEERSPVEENVLASDDSGKVSDKAMGIDEEINTSHDQITVQQQDTPDDEDTDREVVQTVHDAEIGDPILIVSDDVKQESDEIELEHLSADTDDQLNGEIEELLTLLGLSQSMIEITNEMITPPEGKWEAPEGYRAIINPGGVGQPRDGDSRAAFMIYDTEDGFEFYRVPYAIEKTQEKIIHAGLPQYLAVRLAFGR